jgi:hypothetical protein
MSTERSFDELAKGLANKTISRSDALKWAGGAFFGSLLASVPGVAWAADGGNSACAHICEEAFDPGRDRGQCTSEFARSGCPTCQFSDFATCNDTGQCGCPPGCFCRQTAEGETICVNNFGPGTPIPGGPACQTSADCPNGSVCIQGSDSRLCAPVPQVVCTA